LSGKPRRVALVDCQFGIYRASAASPLSEGERIKVRGVQSVDRDEIIPPPAPLLAKGEATRTAELTIRNTTATQDGG